MSEHIHSVLIAILVVSVVWQYQSHFFSVLDIESYGKAYSQSQYVLGEKSPAKIDDATLYTYASHAYWQGDDPTTINFEHPPLAKYYYGVFIIAFGNPHWGSLLLFVGVLLLLNAIVQELKFSRTSRIFLLIVVGSLSLLRVHTRYTLLDLPLLFGTLLIFWSAIKVASHNHLKYSLLLGVGIAVVAGAKYWFPWLIVLLGFIALEAVRNKKIKPYLIAGALGLSMYLLSYASYFLHGHTLNDFVLFEWFRFNWFSGKIDAPKFLVFQTLFTGQFKAWWAADTYEKTQYWSWLWPVGFFSAVWAVVLSLVAKEYWMVILIGYSLVLLLIFAIGAAASDRFFIQLLPFWMLALTYLVDRLIVRNHAIKKSK